MSNLARSSLGGHTLLVQITMYTVAHWHRSRLGFVGYVVSHYGNYLEAGESQAVSVGTRGLKPILTRTLRGWLNYFHPLWFFDGTRE